MPYQIALIRRASVMSLNRRSARRLPRPRSSRHPLGRGDFGTRAHRLADGERALRELLNLLPCEDDGDGQPSTTRARTLASDLLREVSAIRARPEWTITPAWPTTPQGRPTKPWNARARKALGVLGVPAEARDAILQAAGLILTPTVAENI